MNQAIIITVAVLLFGLLSAFSMHNYGPRIEQMVQQRAEATLAEAGFDWVTVAADGNAVTMRGSAPSHTARSEALRLVTNITGIRRVQNEMQLPDEMFNPLAAVSAYETRITVSPGFVQYSGFVPSAQLRTELIARTRELYRGRRVEDEMTVRDDGVPDNWLEATTNLQQRFATYVNAEGVISDSNINVVGKVAPGRQGETKLLASRLPDNFVARINLSVAKGNAESCQARLDELMKRKISFQVASAVIDPASYALLDQLSERIRECGGLRIEVAGHTDAEGLAMKNLELSQRRAEAVAAYLVGKGLDADQLVPWGYGESRPVGDNSTAAGRAANRRIEFLAMD
ncbi:MAG: OmpA family protein [Gammaproteobacteria bacterium]|nr:OmpA family protein [Gammaproteobacteria bacterium]NNF60137.1 OmpA family protein [Gammaproteobacteria bacterium]NNM21549.1 OmpA family protein [Gammaproteobacteria bacterium]